MSASSKKKLRKEQNAAQLTEKQLKEKKEARKLKVSTTVFVTVIALILVVGLLSFGLSAFKNSGIRERSTTALTIGDHKISSAELSYFYMDAINQAYNDWYSAYGQYTYAYVQMLIGLDMSKPLDEQMYNAEEGKTFADMFVDQAVQNAVDAYTMYDKAVAANHTLAKEEQVSMNNAITQLNFAAVSNGFANSTEYLKAMYGNGSTDASYRKYLEVITLSNSYQLAMYDSLIISDDEIKTYNDEHFGEFSSYSYCSFYMNANDFLVCTADEDDKDHQHTDEEKEAGLKAAEAAANKIVAQKPTSPVALNNAIKQFDPYKDSDTAVCSEVNDAMYSTISNADIAAWLSEDGRKIGDVTVITHSNESTDADGNTVSKPYGYTVVLFVGTNDNNAELINVRHILKKFTGGSTDSNGNKIYSDEEKKVAMDALEILKKTWQDNGGSEAQFASLANANTEDTGSKATGGLYENVYPGQMVEAFNDWCFDPARKAGDTTIIETEYGYHLMYFSGKTGVTYRNSMITETLRNNKFDEWFLEAVETVKYELHTTSGLRLDMVITG